MTPVESSLSPLDGSCRNVSDFAAISEVSVPAHGKSGMNYYIDRWLDDSELSRSCLVKMIEEPKSNSMRKYIYMEAEEQTKMRFLNTEAGYLLCQRSTTGWAPMSETCKRCEYKKQCEQATEKRLPELVRLRKEQL